MIFTGYIYKTTNLLTNKSYIGKKTGNPNKSKDYLGSGIRFCHSLKAHGKFYFQKDVIGIIKARTKKELIQLLNEAETECIYFFRTYGADGEHYDEIYGYNLTKGGDGGDIISTHPNNTKIREHLSKMKKDFYKTTEGKKVIERRSKKHIGKTGYWSGKHRSVEQNQKTSNTIKNVPHSQIHNQHVSESLKRHAVSKETRIKISNSLKGNVPWNKGKTNNS